MAVLDEFVHRADYLVAEAGAPVVHRHRDSRPQVPNDLRGSLGVNGVVPAHGDQQHIHFSQSRKLLRRKSVPQVAQVRHPQSLRLQNMDCVAAPQNTAQLVVEAGQRFHP